MDDTDSFSFDPSMLNKPFEKKVPILSKVECLCGKSVDITTAGRPWYSGIVNYTEILCGGCRKEFEGMPKIVCLSCKSLMGFYKPGKQSTGFVFESNRHYHIDGCPRCQPDVVSTPVLEHERFCAANKIPTKRNLDLVEEIQQKHLQASAEADRLRSEFEKSSDQNED